jgi:DNA-binding XRE family transcriptional regulator
MPNIGAVLRDEITRLSRKESRIQIDSTKRTTASHRKDIALLKRQVTQLERQVKALSRTAAGTLPTLPATAGATKFRSVAKGLRSQRARLGLSAADFGKLIGVSAQSIYNWESEKARPRAGQIARVAQLRLMGKREARGELSKLR